MMSAKKKKQKASFAEFQSLLWLGGVKSVKLLLAKTESVRL